MSNGLYRIGKDIVMAVKEGGPSTRFNGTPKGSNPECQAVTIFAKD